jgi:hypothetical protein
LAAVAGAAFAGPFDLAVANLRLAPTSSASIAVTDRVSLSGLSQFVDDPWAMVTMTRARKLASFSNDCRTISILAMPVLLPPTASTS